MHPDFPISDISQIPSPALLLFPERIERNIASMIRLAGSADRLRPHVKTHKMPEIVRLLAQHGIHKHKCATVAEAEMVADAGGQDVLLGYPLVGPNPVRVARLAQKYPGTIFRAVVDEEEPARALSHAYAEIGHRIPVMLDLDIGMGRTGMAPDKNAVQLYRLIHDLPGLVPDGLHAYDGHQRAEDPAERRRLARAGAEAVFVLRNELEQADLPVPRLVLGGTPTFPIHAEWRVPGVECSPGTCILHDMSYMTKFPDLPFEPAAILLGRVISRPGHNTLCVDLGHKAVAADPVGDRLKILNIPDARLGPQSEEHLVVETASAADRPPGSPVLAIPTHICPTCALHAQAYVVEQGHVRTTWDVTARARRLTV